MAHDHSSAEGVLELHPKGYGFLRKPRAITLRSKPTPTCRRR